MGGTVPQKGQALTKMSRRLCLYSLNLETVSLPLSGTVLRLVVKGTSTPVGVRSIECAWMSLSFKALSFCAALVTMATSEAANRAIDAPAVMAGTASLEVNPFSPKQAAVSTGAMNETLRRADSRTTSRSVSGSPRDRRLPKTSSRAGAVKRNSTWNSASDANHPSGGMLSRV